MKILLITPLFPPDIGGPATYAKLLKEELPKRGLDIRVLAFSEVRHLPKVISHTAFFIKILKEGRTANKIFALDLISVGWPAYFANLFLRKELITKFVGDQIWEQMSQRAGINMPLDEFRFSYLRHPYFAFLRLLQLLVAKGSHRIIVPSQYLKKLLMGWKIESDKITVIYNTFQAPKMIEPKSELKQKLGLGGKVIMSAGRLVPWKGFDTLIKTMPDIIQNIPDAALYIAGEGPEMKNLKSQISNLKLDDRVILLGRLNQSVLFEYIKASDVFALNSSYEGLSHQLLEVMALETPIVTTKAGGNAETIDHGESGILIEYNNKAELKDAILKCLNDQVMTEGFVKSGREKLRMFEEEKILEETARFLLK